MLSTSDLPASQPTFVLDRSTLDFGHAVVGVPTEARVHLHNPGSVPCTVQLSVSAAQRAGKKGDDTPAVGFTVDPPRLTIQSHDTTVATVCFTPTMCTSFDGVFEACVIPSSERIALDYPGASFKYAVCGRGALPSVRLVNPIEKRADGATLLRFRRTRVGEQRIQAIKVVNPGPLPARVVLKIVKDDNTLHTISRSGSRATTPRRGGDRGGGIRKTKSRHGPESSNSATSISSAKGRRAVTAPADGIDQLPIESSGALLNANENFTCLGDGLPVTVPPGASKVLSVAYIPSEPRVHNCTVRVCVIDNIFETSFVECTAEGHIDPVGVELEDDQEVLAFGDVPLGTKAQKSFMITNTARKAQRYEFAQVDEFKFSPRVGILKANSSKTITCTFEPRAPGTHENTQFACQFEEVAGGDDEDDMDWDDSLQVVRWQIMEGPEGSLQRVKVVEAVPEPDLHRNPASEHKLSLAASAISGYSEFTVTASDGPLPKEAQFEETLMYQTRTYSLKLKNNGVVRFPFRFNVVNDDMESDADSYLPFSVVPREGVLQPGTEIDIAVNFTPLDVGKFEAALSCVIPSVAPDSARVAVDLIGTAQRPVCHIDLPTSDYLQQDRSTLRGPGGELGEIDPLTKVVEIECSGLSVTKSVSFDVINPTAKDLRYRWTAVSADKHFVATRRGALVTAGPFKCHTSVGMLHSGAQRQMTFEYRPASLDVCESFWNFEIESEGVCIPFVVVGHAREPKVSFTTRFVNLVPLLVGESTTETVYLRNDEDTPQTFNFGRRAILDINKAASLTVTPSEGTVQPKRTQPIAIKFSPKLVQPYNFQLSCRIKNKAERETLTVKCLAHSIDCSLVTIPGGKQMGSSSDTAVDLGVISAFDWASRTFELANRGELPIECKWKNGTKRGQQYLDISPPFSFVGPGESERFIVKFSPNSTRETVLKNILIKCCVVNGPTYGLRIDAVAQLPQLDWSFTEYDFGDAFIWQQNMPQTKVMLLVTNKEPEHSVSIVSLHKKTPWLEIAIENVVLDAGEHCEIPIVFTPRDAQNFSDVAVFEVNGKQKISVPFRGRGVPLDLVLETEAERKIQLGPVVVGSVAKRTVNLVNRSRLPITFTVSKTSSPAGTEALSFAPSGVVKSLPPKGICPLDFVFSPKKRIKAFTETFSYFTMGIDRELMVVRAACHAVKVELDNQQIFFPQTTINGSVSRRVVLHNAGDIGTKFEWQTSKKLDKWFALVPQRGYVAPGAEIVTVVTFHPRVAAEGEVRFEGIECKVEGLADPLRLDVTALGAVASQVEKEVLTFTTPVRTRETKSIKVTNTSNEWWYLHPMFDNDVFSGDAKISIPPGGSAQYTVVYTPITMTQSLRPGGGAGASRDALVRDEILSKSHNATLFIALPDGSSTVYSLVGYATTPKSFTMDAEEVPCKVTYRKALPVRNWLQQSQRFRAIIKCGDKKADQSTELKPAISDTIDVPGGMVRDFFIDFFAYRENATVNATVTFQNEETQEYVVFELVFRTTSAGILDTVQLRAAVRTRAIHKVTLRNPLAHTVTFNMTCVELGGPPGQRNVPCPDIRGPTQIKVAGKSTDTFEFEFLPLFVREKQAQLTLSSADLGNNTYMLSLVSTDPAPCPTEEFETPLGSTEMRTIKVMNMAPSRGERAKYKIAISSNAFKFKSAGDTVSPGNDNIIKVPISFEPGQLGVVRATMTLNSATGGQFDIPLVGNCLNPVPAGPFTIKAGGKVTIPFKNVLDETCKYVYVVSNNQFTAKDSEDWKPKEEKDIVVKYEGNRDPTIRTARLLVRCQSGACAGAEWNFYLKGIP